MELPAARSRASGRRYLHSCRGFGYRCQGTRLIPPCVGFRTERGSLSPPHPMLHPMIGEPVQQHLYTSQGSSPIFKERLRQKIIKKLQRTEFQQLSATFSSNQSLNFLYSRRCREHILSVYCSNNFKNSASESTGIPSSWALRNLEPAASPATT